MRDGAGILVRCLDAVEREYRYLVQQRGPGARDYQGTWDATAGGSLLDGENPLDGALREHEEEVGPLPAGLLVVHSVTWAVMPSGARRKFTSFLAEVQGQYSPQPDPQAVAAWAWLAAPVVWRLDLHPNFAREFAALSRSGPL